MGKRNRLFGVLILAGIFYCHIAQAQEVYTIDLSKQQPAPVSGHLKMGTHTNAAGHSLDANSLYFIKDGKPWYPVMGEFHFSRYPKQKWEESVLKMKACGIDVIATYVFWIYHEEREGRFDWTGDRDLRYFIELCKKHDIAVLVRIGPWCHGEARNGGLPDWIVKRGNFRRNDSAYLHAVKDLYGAIAKQLAGLYFKDGGPIVGAQIENEFRFNNPTGLEHILTLKRMAVDAGIDVPFYTATAWQGANLTQDELVPVWGAYPEAPWDKRTTTLPLSENYLFSILRNDPTIGNDLLGQRKDDAADYKGYRYPYATAEMGGGIQVTYHRRPVIAAEDVTALAYTKAGSGANLMGYYMFHGGSHAIGRYSTMQESRATNYPNDYPVISYDFQAPLGEFGQLRPSYRWFKVLHSFFNHFGDRLVQYYPYFPDQKPAGAGDSTMLRFAVRAKGNQGFIFISNYQRQLKLTGHNAVQVQLKLADGRSVTVFDKPIAVPAGLQAVLPFNMDVEGVNLISATLQPLTVLKGDVPTYVFFQPGGLKPVYVFDKNSIHSITATGGRVQQQEGKYLVTDLKPGTGCMITVKTANGKQVNILTLTQQQALDSWQGDAFGKERLLITAQNITFNNGVAQIQSTGDPKFDVSVFPAIKTLKTETAVALKPQANGIFSRFTWQVPAVQMIVKAEPVTDITAFQNKGEQLPADDRNEKNTAARPGPQYQTNLQPVKNAGYWRIRLPALKRSALLVLDYNGDTGAAYEDGKLFADDFYFGADWQIGLHAGVEAHDIIVQVVPFSADRDVFFEKEISSRVHADMTPKLKTVKLLSNYTTVLAGAD
ncbi:MAG: beta-galactosidase [Chitinophagaceae bacterium]